MDLQDLENIFWGDRREQPTSVRLARVVQAIRRDIKSKASYPNGDRDLVIFNNDEYFRELLGEPPVASLKNPPGVDPNTHCQWDPVKDSDRLWFAWCKTQPGMREYQIAPSSCPGCNLPVVVVGGFSA